MLRSKQTTELRVSLPREVAEQVETVRRAECRTRSELVCEALRHYFSRPLRVEKATPEEVRAIERGRRAAARGETITLAEYVRGMDARADEARPKKSRPSSRS